MANNISEVTPILNGLLDPKHIKTRSKGGATLGYVESWHVINEANRVFGFDGWDCETLACIEVTREKNSKGNWVVGFAATVRLRVRIGDVLVVRDGSGNGSGVANALFDAYEGGYKEAETDAMKRAFRTFGNIFGLALYDKDRKAVGDSPVMATPAQMKALEELVSMGSEATKSYYDKNYKSGVSVDSYDRVYKGINDAVNNYRQLQSQKEQSNGQ